MKLNIRKQILYIKKVLNLDGILNGSSEFKIQKKELWSKIKSPA